MHPEVAVIPAARPRRPARCQDVAIHRQWGLLDLRRQQRDQQTVGRVYAQCLRTSRRDRTATLKPQLDDDDGHRYASPDARRRPTVWSVVLSAFHVRTLKSSLLRLPSEDLCYAFNLIRFPMTKSTVEIARLIEDNRATYERIRDAGGTLYLPVRGTTGSTISDPITP